MTKRTRVFASTMLLSWLVGACSSSPLESGEAAESSIEGTYEVHNGEVYFEGDIRVGPANASGPVAPGVGTQSAGVFDRSWSNGFQATFLGAGTPWPNNTVRWTFHSSVTAAKRTQFTNAVNHWESRTSLDFVEIAAPLSGDYLLVRGDDTSSVGCASFMGRQGGPQDVDVGRADCGQNSMVHEIGHAIGLIHEHSRPDRDSVVDVDEPADLNWGKFASGTVAAFGAYDDRSVMHYCTLQGDIHYLNGSNVPCNTTGLTDADVRGAQIMYGSEYQPSIASTSWSGRADAFVRALDGSIQYRTLSGSSWSAWQSLGGIAVGGPTAISRGSNNIDVFVRDLNQAVRWKHFGGTWDASWANLGGTITAQPNVVATSSTTMRLFGRGASGEILEKSWNGTSWSPSATGWTTLGGLTVGPMVAISRSSGTADLFVVDTNRGLQTRAFNGTTWGGWVALGGFVTGMPAVVSTGASRIDVVVKGTDNQLYHRFWNGTVWSASWSLIGATPISGNPELVKVSSSRFDLFYHRASDGTLVQRTFTTSWSAETAGVGGVIGTPDVSSSSSTRLDAFVRGTDNSMFHRSWNGTSWSGFTALGGAISW